MRLLIPTTSKVYIHGWEMNNWKRKQTTQKKSISSLDSSVFWGWKIGKIGKIALKSILHGIEKIFVNNAQFLKKKSPWLYAGLSYLYDRKLEV